MSHDTLTAYELLNSQLWLKKNFRQLTLEDMALAIEQLRPYIEKTMPESDIAFLRQWNGLLCDNWHSLALIQTQATAKVKPYQDEFNERSKRLLDLLSQVEFAVDNFDLGNEQTRRELNIISGQFTAIRFAAMELKETLPKIKPWVLGIGFKYPYDFS